VLAKSLLYSGELVRRSIVARAAVQSVGHVTDPRARGLTLHFCVQALSEPEQHGERRALTDQLIELARAGHDHQLLLHACFAQLQVELELGELSAVDRAISHMEALAAHARQPYFRWIATCVRAMRATTAGQLTVAEELADEALRLGRNFFGAAAHTVQCVQRTGIWCLRGQLVPAAATARQLSSLYPGLTGWRAILAFLEAQLGHADQARQEFQRLVNRGLASARRDPFVLSALAPLADLGVLVGDEDGVRLLYDTLKPYAGYHAVVMGGIFTHGPVERHLGMLAAKLKRFEAAEAHFQRAIQQSERMPSVPYLCLTRQSYALMLAKSGGPPHRERAARELNRAFSLSRAHGISQVSTFCRRTARRFGFQLPDAPRQQEPVLVAAGSNARQ
jgi:tetratricopeptide (TPR) repeat protein